MKFALMLSWVVDETRSVPSSVHEHLQGRRIGESATNRPTTTSSGDARRRTAPGADQDSPSRLHPDQPGLRHDIRAGLIQPGDAQVHALRQIVCRLLVRRYGELIAYGAGWTDPERQDPVGDTSRHEPRQPYPIADAELERALADRDPLRGIAQLAARWAAAFVLDPAGVTRTKALGSERMERKLRDALPGGEGALRAAVWEFMRPMLSPALVALNRDAFVVDDSADTTVDLEGHRAASDLEALALDDEPNADAA
jgi:hypothetical protein